MERKLIILPLQFIPRCQIVTYDMCIAIISITNSYKIMMIPKQHQCFANTKHGCLALMCPSSHDILAYTGMAIVSFDLKLVCHGLFSEIALYSLPPSLLILPPSLPPSYSSFLFLPSGSSLLQNHNTCPVCSAKVSIRRQ